MKKLYILIALFICNLFILAIADDLQGSSDLWDSWNTTNEPYIKQNDKNAVSDEEFNKLIDKLKEKKNKKENKKLKKQLPKGEAFNDMDEGEQFQEEVKDNSLPVICIPTELKIGDTYLPIGHYQVNVEKENNQWMMKLFQAHYLMAQFPAQETNEDFGEDTITFGKIEFEDNQIKIMFGSMEVNAYAVILVEED